MNSTMKLLQRKVFGMPAWVLGVIAVGLLAYYLYRKHASAAAAAAAAGTTAASSGASGTAASDNGIGDSVGYLGGYPPITPSQPGVTTTPPGPGPGGIASPGPGTAPPAVPQQTQQGSGYWLGPVATPIHGQDGYWYQWESPAVALAFPSAQRYIQIEPGYFVAMTSSTHLAAGTPQFLRTAAPVPGYNYGSNQIPAPGAPAQPVGSIGAPGALSAA